MRRFAKNRDRGERAIIEALESVGAKVLPLNSDIRAGVPDLLVARGDFLILMEVKDMPGPRGGTRNRDGQHLSKAQEAFHKIWSPHCCVVRSPIEALIAIRAIDPNDPNVLHRGRVDSVSVDP